MTTKASKIYHAKAAQARVETALRDTLGLEISTDAPVRLFVRIEKNFATFSLDTSGELLHKRGFKQAVVKAPIRETMAASFLRQCGYTGTEPVLDPMCGSGTFLIEAAEIAAGLAPGRERSFAFETLATFDHDCWTALKAGGLQRQHGLHFYGSDRDPGAVRSATANAERAGLAQEITIREAPVSDLQRPDGPPGLVMVNPPYGARIGQNAPLRPLYAALGQSLRARFSGWRVGLVTTDAGLVAATGLPFAPPGPPIPHGGLKVKLWRTEAL